MSPSPQTFSKDGRVQQAAVVENKALAGALLAIQAKQREREELVLSKRKRSLRDEDILKKACGGEGQPNRRVKPRTAVNASALSAGIRKRVNTGEESGLHPERVSSFASTASR
jgi:hypothetical protein